MSTGSREPSAHETFDLNSIHPALETLFHNLHRVNQQINLTAIRDLDAMRIQHGEDSLALVRLDPETLFRAKSLVDIGTGAGFPLLPLALVRPDLPGHGVDSVAKKLRFIEDATKELGLAKIQVHGTRAETLGTDPHHRESHDLVTSRAVGPVASLLEVGLPLLQKGGILVLYKTEPAVAELDALQSVVRLLGGEILPHLSYQLPGDRLDRVLLRIRKVSPTPNKFPRSVGTPFHKPLAPEQLR